MMRFLANLVRAAFVAVFVTVLGAGAVLGAALRSLFGPRSEAAPEPPLPSLEARIIQPPPPKRKRRVLRTLLLAGLALAGLGALIVVSGIIPIPASSRHWPITEWFLHFTMRRSVNTHSIGTKPPVSLDDRDLILKGATHYEVGCRSCHGAPGMRQPMIPHQMTPHPPELSSRMGDWKPRELFYVVKNGVKFTGMPAWAALGREDEVWAVVAFLKQLPGMDAAAYRKWTDSEPPPTAQIETLGNEARVAPAVTQTCARCHGHDGIARGEGAFPHLAGQRAEYLRNALVSYANRSRHSGIMGPIAGGLSDEMAGQLADYYSSLRPSRTPVRKELDSAAIERGRRIAEEGLREQRLPACLECHGPQGKSAYPQLDGQPARYLVEQLELFKNGLRGGSQYAHLMDPVVQRLKPEQIQDVARYFESLPLPSTAAGDGSTNAP